MEFIKNVVYQDCNCQLYKSTYADGNRTALLIEENGWPVCTCSVNIPDAHLLDDEILIKDYSENEGMLEFLEKEGVVKNTGRSVRSGYVTVPVCKLLV